MEPAAMTAPHVPTLDRSLLLARHGYLFTAVLSSAERRRLHETRAVSIPFLGRPSLLVNRR
jgi:fatty-acid peroxygenase